MKKIELLAPAGNLERLKVAFAYGADAVYLGGQKYSLRARASNFTIEDIKEAVNIAKSYNGKIYVTCNIVAHNSDLLDPEDFKNYIKDLDSAGVSAVIISDIGLIDLANEVKPNLEIHVSTQLSTMNSETINLLKQKGATRVVLARECSLKEIKDISKKSPLELEVFIHGGMCMSISGKCVLSNYMTRRDANRGGCAQSCRWFYNIYDEDKRKISDNLFTFSSKDLQTLPYIKKLIKYDVKSLKIEGRMKSEYYLATIISQYRKLIDDIYDKKTKRYKHYVNETLKAESRPTSHGFIKGKITPKEQIFDKTAEIPLQDFVARVLSYDPKTKLVKIEQRNNFTIKNPFEVLTPNGTFTLTINEMWDENNEMIDIAKHAKQILYFKSDIEFSNFDMFRQNKRQ